MDKYVDRGLDYTNKYGEMFGNAIGFLGKNAFKILVVLAILLTAGLVNFVCSTASGTVKKWKEK